MNNRPEPDDVDFFVGGAPAAAGSADETARIIKEYKNRPDYPPEAEEAERILAALGIKACDYGMPDAKSLLDHWHQCVADLRKADSGGNNGARVDNEGIEGGSRLPTTK